MTLFAKFELSEVKSMFPRYPFINFSTKNSAIRHCLHSSTLKARLYFDINRGNNNVRISQILNYVICCTYRNYILILEINLNVYNNQSFK